MEDKVKDLINETNCYYDLNIPDVASWIIDNKLELLKILNSEAL